MGWGKGKAELWNEDMRIGKGRGGEGVGGGMSWGEKGEEIWRGLCMCSACSE